MTYHTKTNTMTAVEWLIEQILSKDINIYNELYKELMMAKQLEKEQIIDAWENGAQAEHRAKISGLADSDSFRYYNETYGSKGSDEN